MTDFSQFNLRPELLQAIQVLGYETPTPIQTLAIPALLSGEDVIGQAQTGTGKTAAFSLPMLEMLEAGRNSVQGLVLTPTRELAIQVAQAIYEYGHLGGASVLAVYGGASYSRQIARLKRGVNVVVGTPGRLLDLMRQGVLKLGEVRMVVLDEADEMLSMGFIEDIEAILQATPTERQTALFSATLPPAIRELAGRYLHTPRSLAVERKQVTVEAIEQRYYLVREEDKLAALTRLLEIEPVSRALIFARTRASSGDLAATLSNRGYPVEVLNGDLTQETRERVLNRFRNNELKIVVATDVAARGLDIDDISHVFNFDLPDDEELYVHRIGRTGRAGKSGIALSLVTPREQWRLRKIENFARCKLNRCALPTEEEILARRDAQLLEQLTVWLQRSRYRRERDLVTQLVEAGHDPLEVAAAALKIARSEEKQRPIAAVSEIAQPEASTRTRDSELARGIERRPGRRAPAAAFESGGMRSSGEAVGRFERRRPARSAEGEPGGREPGMARLTLNRGKAHGVRPNDVVSTIAYHADIPGYTIGRIRIQQDYTLVDVPEQFLSQVLARAEHFRLQRQPVQVEQV